MHPFTRHIGLAVLWLSLLAAAPALAANTVPDSVVCPVDGTNVDIMRPIAANAMGGTDSDFCQYSAGGQIREHAVATCPTCLYSGLHSSFDRELIDAQRRALLEMLETLGPTIASTAELQTWDRYQIAALCAGVLEESALQRGNLLHTAAWTVRDRFVGFIPMIDGPLDAHNKLDELDVDYTEIPDLRTQQMALFDLSRLAHRGGFNARRDAYLNRLDDLPPVPEELIAVRAMVEEWIATENRFLGKALEHFNAGLDRGEGEETEKLYYRYITIDIRRRLGQEKGLREELNMLLADPNMPDNLKPMAKGLKEVMRVEAEGE